MKRDHSKPKIGTKRRILQGCVLATFLALMGTGAAKADTFTCDTVPSTFTGDIDINQAGACVIGSGLAATGHIKITAPSVEVDGDVSAGAGLSVTANTSSINITGNVSFNNAQNGGNALLFAQTDIATGSITAAQGGSQAAVDIKANLAGGNDLFTVNGSAQSNGVNGPISAVGVYITNGTDTSTGGITLSGTSPITIQSYSATPATAQGLFLDAKQGIITLPAGTLSADGGATGLPAGTVALAAAEVDAPDGAVLSASDDGAGSSFISVAATTVNSGSDLSVHADGGNKQLFLLPTGAITFSDNQDPSNLTWSATNNVFGVSGDLALNVSGNALVTTANGPNSSISVAGNNIAVSANDATFQSQGTSSNYLLFTNNGGGTGYSLAFNVTDATSLDVSGALGGAGGSVSLYPDNLTVTGNHFTVNANGPATGDGQGGFIISYASNLSLDPTVTTVSVTANASGTADGGTIYLTDLFAGQITANAATGGNAGSINLSPSHAITPASVVISANGGTTGAGGQINISLIGGDYIDPSNSITATGGSVSGNGGTFTLNAGGDLTLAYPTIDVSAPGTGNGGTFNANIVDGAKMYTVGTMNLQAQVDGQGGQLNVTGSADIYSTVNASGADTGKGGAIVVSGKSFNLQFGGQLLVDGGDHADGGTVTVTTTGSGPLDWSTAGAISLNAGAVSGNGGQLTVAVASDLTIGGTFYANGSVGGAGNGGSMTITSTAFHLTSPVVISADAKNSGNGGTITVHSSSAVDLSSLTQNNISARGVSEGLGGQVTFDLVSSEPANISIDKVIAVSGGDDIDKTEFDGSINLNGITCQQWVGIHDVWGKSYWNCANPSQPTDNEEAPIAAAASLPDAFITALNNEPSVAIFVMSKGSDFAAFFQQSGVDNNSFGTHNNSLRVAAIFDNTDAPGTMTDVSANLAGALMHQLGLLLDAYNGNASQQTGAGSFGEAVDADQALMTGNYPSVPQSPSCMDVYNASGFCNEHSADANPWITFKGSFIKTADLRSELFAYAFQNCSGNEPYSTALTNAERSNYLGNVYRWMDAHFWPGGCNWFPPGQPQAAISSNTVLNQPAQLMIQDSITAADILTVKVQDDGLSGGFEQVSYTVQAGDTYYDLINGLALAIQADAQLQTIGVTAFVSGPTTAPWLNIQSNSTHQTTYTVAVNSVGTEDLQLSTNPNVTEVATVGGTPSSGDTFDFVVHDTALANGQQTVSYMVANGDTLASIAASIASAVNNDSSLQQIGITATSDAEVVTLNSNSMNVSTYTASVTNPASTLSLGVKPTVHDFVISGTPVVGNVLDIEISDGSNFDEIVSYQVQSGDDFGAIACGLASDLNGNDTLTQHGITATCASSGVMTVQSESSTYAFSQERIVDFRPQPCFYVPKYRGPGELMRCGSAKPSDPQVQTVKTTLQTIATDPSITNAAKRLKRATWLRYYVFGTDKEYTNNKYIIVSASRKLKVLRTESESDLGITFQGGSITDQPAFVVLFEKFGTKEQVVDTMAYAAAHETGHIVDILYGAPSGWNGVGSVTPWSNNTYFTNAWSRDQLYATFVPACGFDASDRRKPNPGNSSDLSGKWGWYSNPFLPGYFSDRTSGRKSKTGTSSFDFICSGKNLLGRYSGDDSGGSNLAIMRIAYPRSFYWTTFFPSENYFQPWQELFADEFAYVVGILDVPDGASNVYPGSYLAFEINQSHGGSWSCSQLYTERLVLSNSPPSQSDLTTYGVNEPLKFTGDTNNVKYGAPAITGTNAYRAVLHHACDGTTPYGSSYLFGSDNGGG